MKVKFAFLIIVAFALTLACEQKKPARQQNTLAGAAQQVVVDEVIQATSYTYLKVKSPSASYWLACTKTTVNQGEAIYHDHGLEMRDFHSKELNRTFDKIYFVQSVRRQAQAPGSGLAIKPFKKMQPDMLAKGPVETVAGELPLAELFGNKEKYANKRVTVSGKVTKFLPEIMNKNFLHIQNPKDSSEKLDLSITTQDKVKVGDIVKFTGTISLNKDFGAGYLYEVIMEDAQLQKGM